MNPPTGITRSDAGMPAAGQHFSSGPLTVTSRAAGIGIFAGLGPTLLEVETAFRPPLTVRIATVGLLSVGVVLAALVGTDILRHFTRVLRED